MNRRSLLIRTITGAMSATVFTATGWLMGTRTLTMENCSCYPPGTPCNWNCGDLPDECWGFECPPNSCKLVIPTKYGCSGLGCACICAVGRTYFPCGSCQQHCAT